MMSVRPMRLHTILASACLLGSGMVAAAQSARPSPITPAGVERMIERHGARATIARLTRPKPRSEFGDYDQVLAGIGRGDARWLALAPKLRPGTDAATAEALIVSVAEALPRNPRAVLRLVRRERSWSKACTFPMIEPTLAAERAYFRKTIPAVRSVHDADLRPVRQQCLNMLAKAQRT